MFRKGLILLGFLVSVTLGYGVFHFTGLLDSCESFTLKCALTGTIILTYLISYANGVRSGTVPVKMGKEER